MDNFEKRVDEIAGRNTVRFNEIFRHCHMYPEVSLREYETTKYIKSTMGELGIGLHGTQPETGAVFLLEGGKPGPCVALRADIDALPVREQSTCPFPSLNEGVMHACGHDAHYGGLLCAAIILNELKKEIPGSIKFIFQPAEEINMGGRILIPSGVLEDPHVEAIYSYHTSPDIPTGQVAAIHGPVMASVDDLIITVRGKGGHGGIPHRTADPVVASAAVITGLQTVVSRNVSPVDSGVVTIASVIAGAEKVQNVIPDEVRLYGTIRAYREDTRRMMWERVRSICRSISEAYGCEADVDIIRQLPVTDNLPEDGRMDLYDIALRSVKAAGAVPVTAEPSGGGDDFSFYLKGVDGYPGTAGFYYWLGIRNEQEDCVYSWHSSNYRVDPAAVPIGAKLLAVSALITLDELGGMDRD